MRVELKCWVTRSWLVRLSPFKRKQCSHRREWREQTATESHRTQRPERRVCGLAAVSSQHSPGEIWLSGEWPVPSQQPAHSSWLHADKKACPVAFPTGHLSVPDLHFFLQGAGSKHWGSSSRFWDNLPIDFKIDLCLLLRTMIVHQVLKTNKDIVKKWKGKTST